MKIYGRLYGETPRYYDFDDNHKWPYYDKLEEKEWDLEYSDVNDGEKWLIDNYPEYYMGACIQGNNGDFILTAIPGVEYGYGNFETIQNRISYVKTIKEMN